MTAVEILQREIVRGMRLLGVSNVKQLVPEMVSISSVLRPWVGLMMIAQVERVDWQPITPKL